MLASLGAILLVGVYLPVLNPWLMGMGKYREMPSVGYYIVATPIPVLILVASWRLNKEAQAIRRAYEEASSVSGFQPERRPKWILGVLVIVLLAIVVIFC